MQLRASGERSGHVESVKRRHSAVESQRGGKWACRVCEEKT
jgi:hypothetical protein